MNRTDRHAYTTSCPSSCTIYDRRTDEICHVIVAPHHLIIKSVTSFIDPIIAVTTHLQRLGGRANEVPFRTSRRKKDRVAIFSNNIQMPLVCKSKSYIFIPDFFTTSFALSKMAAKAKQNILIIFNKFLNHCINCIFVWHFFILITISITSIY